MTLLSRLPVCNGIPNFKGSSPVTETYVRLVNRVLQERGTGLQWIPDGAPGDRYVGKVASSDLSRYMTGWRVHAAAIQAAFCDARRIVEERRMAMVRAADAQMKIVESPTFDHLDSLNRAESAWLQLVSARLAFITDQLYTAQTSLESDALCEWMKDHADPVSMRHFQRIRTDDLPILLEKFMPENIPEASLYASSIALFPDRPAYSAMYPHDFTAGELEFIEKKYPSTHPIRQPFTVIERATKDNLHLDSEGNFQRGPGGQEIRWLVEGPDKQSYIVTHMRFHPRYEGFFLQFAYVLRRYADICVGGETLHPNFKDYVLTMARCLRSGDFVNLLKADLNQVEGNLFLTFFPHEGYWDDGIKFPWMFEVGIRDRIASEKFRERGYIFEKLEERAREIGSRVGASAPTHTIGMGDIEKMVQVVWVYKNGGFLRGFPHGIVAGHDYPKADYEGVEGHRVVIVRDSFSSSAAQEQAARLAHEFLPAPDADMINVDVLLSNIIWHEGSHGVSGNKPDTALSQGGTLAQALGSLWGKLVEPQSDVAFVVANRIAFEDGKISKEEREAALRRQFLRLMTMTQKRERVLDREFPAPHPAGATMTLGWLYQEGISITLDENEKFIVDWAQFEAGLARLWEKLTEFGFLGVPDDFFAFYQGCIRAIPDYVEARILAGQRKHLAKNLLNRGDLIPRPY